MPSKYFKPPKERLRMRFVIAAPFIVFGLTILAIGMLINGSMSFKDFKF
jgi:hypothetical protein